MATFAEDLRERFGGGSEADDTLRDLAEHGADAGFPGITYYRDTAAMYDAHAEEIWDALAEDADDMGLAHPLALVATFGGAANVHSQDQLANLLTWYMAERVAHAAQD
jgi:rubrerythrin